MDAGRPVDPLWLVVHGPDADRVVAVTGARLTIGRDLRSDLVVDDAKVSRLHAEITVDGQGRFLLTDLASRNGTTIDGRQVVGAVPLVGGERLRFGRTAVDVHRAPPPEVP